MQQAFGADLSLNHGAIVNVEMDNTSVVHVSGIHQWDKKDNHSLTLKSTPKEISNKVQDIVLSMLPYASKEITVDWSPMSVYWNTKRIMVVQMSMFMGMLYSKSIEKDFNINFIPPHTLRKYWHLPKNTSKKSFQEYVLMTCPPPLSFLRWANEDEIDAYILAVYTILNRENNDNE